MEYNEIANKIYQKHLAVHHHYFSFCEFTDYQKSLAKQSAFVDVENQIDSCNEIKNHIMNHCDAINATGSMLAIDYKLSELAKVKTEIKKINTRI